MNNRLLKFRFWSKNQNKFVDLPRTWMRMNGELNYDFNGEELIVQQFTGLLDKSGKEIYEGDIIESEIEKVSERGEFEDYMSKSTFEVKFMFGLFGGWKFNEFHRQWELINKININFEHWTVKKFEIIGNILEQKT